MMRLPMLPVKDLVLFPHLYVPISVGRDISKKAVYKAIHDYNSEILVILQKDSKNENPSKKEDFYSVGVQCKIIRFDHQVKGASHKLLVQGVQRVRLRSVAEEKDFLVGDFTFVDNLKMDLSVDKQKIIYDTLVKDLLDIIEKGFISEALIPVKELDNPIATCYLLLSITQKTLENQAMLESDNVYDVANQAYKEILKQKNFIEMKENIIEKAKESMTKYQKEYFLKEQMRAIKKELGDDQDSESEIYAKKLVEVEKYMSKSAKEEVQKVIKKLKTSFSESQETSVLKSYLDYVFELPWAKKTEDNIDIKFAKEILDSEHYGLSDVKERILEFLSVKKLNEKSKAPIICFAGPPGTGKCVKEDTLVVVDGVIKKIGQLSKNRKEDTFSEINCKILSESDTQVSNNFYWAGNSETKIITLSNGLELEARYEHPIKTIDENGDSLWKKVTELKVGDVALTRLGGDNLKDLNKISLSKIIETDKNIIVTETPKFLTEDLAKFLGYITGDGGWYENKGTTKIEFHQDQICIEVWEEYLRLHYELFGFYPNKYVSSRQPELVSYQTGRKHLVNFLKKLGFDPYKYKIKLSEGIPDLILNGGVKIWESFIAGLFDTDGSIAKKGDVEITLHSKILIQHLQMLLWTMGIPSNVAKKVVSGETYWRLNVIGGERSSNFKNIIEKMSNISRKENFRLRLGSLSGKNPSRFGYYAPVRDKVIRLWESAIPIPKKQKKIKSIHRYNSFYSHTVFNKILMSIGDRGDLELKKYLTWIYNEMVPLRIVKIEESQANVCDVVVPENATFISNGIVSHNTSIAKSIAASMGRESVRIALGGVKDESEIRGHRRTYVGSMPGRIIQGMKQAGVVNPVFILDEIDKLSSDFKGDPSSALLEVLDPEQNNTFKDHYLNIEYDLSRALFIATANNLETIPPALRDRLEIIKLSGYCEEEKLEIAKRFIIPKKTFDSGLRDKDLKFSDIVLKDVVRHYTKEFGVREMERQISRICRKVAKKKAEGSLKKGISLTKDLVRKLLGSEIYSSLEDNKNGLGVITGLAWTPYGGEILKLETMLIKEKGDAILTGRLGEVMVESAKLGISLIKINAKKWGIDPSILENNRVHVHAPAGAVPKDGPSAGIALVSSMVSLLKNTKIKDSIAMTGEITLTGKVLPVGGIKEKVLAAIRSGIKLVILPIDNKGDFEDASELLAKKIEVKFVSNISEVLKEIF